MQYTHTHIIKQYTDMIKIYLLLCHKSYLFENTLIIPILIICVNRDYNKNLYF